jgi:hypothetical protein
MSAPGAIFDLDIQQPDEFVPLPDEDDGEITNIDDGEGGLLAILGPMEEEAEGQGGGFYTNLAEELPEYVLQKIASDLLERITQDQESRKKSDEQYAKGLMQTGIGEPAPGGADFDGAARTTHPMLAEAAVDFQARIMKELWPAGAKGPVRPNIVGDVTKEKTERAERKTAFLNYQISTIIKEARPTLEKMLTQVPLAGAQYIRQWWDPRLDRVRWTFVPFEKVWIPEGAADYYSATRRTYGETLDGVEFRLRVDSRLYRDVISSPPPSTPDESAAQAANQKIEGVTATSPNLDAQRQVYETMTYLEVSDEMAMLLDFEQPGKLYPYLITIDQADRKILAIYRDWEQEDKTCGPIDHLYEFPFIPWRGAHPVGLAQMVGGLSAAATGALRALLDSAFIANTQGGFILKGSGTSSQTKRPQIGQYQEIDAGGLETPDIRQKVMSFATKEPSQTLFQLLGFVQDAGRGVVRTTLDDDSLNATSNVPVGTQISRVDESLVVFSSLHGRLHEAFDRLLGGLHRLNRQYLPETYRIENGPEILVYRRDFEGPCDVQPVSEPTIYSDQQRFAQNTAIVQRADAKPELYNHLKVERRLLKSFKIADVDELLVAEPEPVEANAVAENMTLAKGGMAYVYDDQDHLAHLQVHLDFMQSPLLGANPIIAPRYLKNALDHCADHILHFYVQHTTQLVEAAAGMPSTALVGQDPKVKVAFDRLLALASQKVMPDTEQAFSKVIPVMGAALAMLQKMQGQPQPMDPAKAALEAATAETERKTKQDQMTGALKARQMELDAKDTAIAEANKAQIAKAGNAAHLAGQLLTVQTQKEIAATKLVKPAPAPKPSFSDWRSLTPNQ